METWKPIPEFEGWYEASSEGQIRRVKPHANTSVGKIRKPNLDKNGGYSRINLCINGRIITRFIHRLVASAFIPNPDNKPEVNHKNGIKSDNRADNLEWATRSENRYHAIDVIKIKIAHGSQNGLSKLTEEQVAEIFRIRNQTDLSHSEIAKLFGVSRSLIGWVLARKGWTHVSVPEVY